MNQIPKNNETVNKYWIYTISILIVTIAILHYRTPTKIHYLHELYRAFFYIPIILAAFRFQFNGGMLSAVAVILIYFPHVVFQWGGGFLYNSSRILEMVMYLLVGGLVGKLVERERNERKKYQRTASELNRSFQQLKVQSEKLAEMEEQLRSSERLSVLGELAASLAHEVRNPLGSIWGVVEILKEECKKSGKDSEFTNILIDEVKRLNHVVENYLSLARKQKLYVKDCNLHDVVQSVVYLLNYKAKKQGIELTVELPSEKILINANEPQLQQILINIILNSIAAIPEKGSVTVKADFDLPENSSNEADRKRSVRLSIIDTGQGMKPGEINNIFKPFYTTRENGTGLGLSIVKRIVDENKWKIDVTSTPGKGTIVTITFPAEVINAESI